MKHQQQPIQQVLFLPLFIFLFMSPDPKGEVSFSHKLVPIVVHLASTISKSSLKTLGQFQLKLVWIALRPFTFKMYQWCHELPNIAAITINITHIFLSEVWSIFCFCVVFMKIKNHLRDKVNQTGMVLVWSPYNIVSDSLDLNPVWLQFLNIEISLNG